jgi:acyl carrier protein
MSEVQMAISDWLKHHLAAVFDIPQALIDGNTTFERYGLDSAAIVGMTGDLGEWLECDVDPAAAYDHPNIDQLAHALAQHQAVREKWALRKGIASEARS